MRKLETGKVDEFGISSEEYIQICKKTKFTIYEKIHMRTILKYIDFKQGMIIEIACGCGTLIQKLRGVINKDINIIGIDIDKELINYAKRLRIPHSNFILSRIDRVPLPNYSSDLTICKSSLYHFINPHIMLSEMLRITKKGKRIVIIVNTKSYSIKLLILMLAIRNLFRKSKQYIYLKNAYPRFNSKKEILKILEETNIKSYKITKPTWFYPVYVIEIIRN